MHFTAFYEKDFNQLDSLDDYAAVELIDAPTWPIALEKALAIGIDRHLDLDSIERQS